MSSRNVFWTLVVMVSASAEPPVWLKTVDYGVQHCGTFADGTHLVSGGFSSPATFETITGDQVLSADDESSAYYIGVLNNDGIFRWVKKWPVVKFPGFPAEFNASADGDTFLVWGRIPEDGMELAAGVVLESPEEGLAHYGARFNVAGEFLAHFVINGFQIEAIRHAPNGQAVMLGQFSGLSNGAYINLVQMDEHFQVIDEQVLSSNDQLWPHRLLVDQMGNMYIGARFRGAVDLDLSEGEFIVESPSGFFVDPRGLSAKFSPEGDVIWGESCLGCEDMVQSVDASGAAYGHAINRNNGYLYEELNFVDYPQLFFSKVSPSGAITIVEVPPVQSTSNISAQGIRYATVRLGGYLNFDYDPGDAVSVPDQFQAFQLLLIRYDPNMKPTYLRPFSWEVADAKQRVNRALGDVYIDTVLETGPSEYLLMGSFAGTVDFDSGEGTSILTTPLRENPDDLTGADRHVSKSFIAKYDTPFADGNSDNAPACGSILYGASQLRGPEAGGLAIAFILALSLLSFR